jgi:hypothetical protein
MKTKKQKLCKCGNKALRNRRICYQCFLKREKAKRELRIIKLKERKKKRVERNHNSYRYLHKTAWDLTSKVVRLSYADKNGMVQCYTCPAILPWKQMQCGHFWHGKLDFDRERNLRPQCPQCNTWKSGNLAIFSTKLLMEIGAKGMFKLMQDAHQEVGYTTEKLKQLIQILERILLSKVS